MESRPENARAPKDAGPAHEPEDLNFHSSSEASLGVEVELQILDWESGDLTPGAVQILQACTEESLEGVSAELVQSMIEVKTGVCRDVGEVRDTLVPLVRRVRRIANSLGYDVGMSGTHPFHRTNAEAVFPAERYQKIQGRMGWLTSQIVVFGLHVHVGMPDGDTAIGVLNTLVQYVPHLLALSANSPFWQGIDTGLASARAALFRLAPRAGLPHYFPNWKEFRTYCEVMRACRALESTKDIYWDIRPRPQQGTIEFRICDVPPTLGAVFSLAALIRWMAISARQLLEERPRARRGDARRFWVAVENKWLATRYGRAAECIRSPGRKPKGLDQDVTELLGRLLPLAQGNADEPFLAPLQAPDQFESGSARQRRLYRETGSWKAITDDMRQRLTEELADNTEVLGEGNEKPAPASEPM